MSSVIEELLECPYWVVDFLPRQVPADCGGRFFAVEPYFLNGTRGSELRRKFADLLLKLNCYYAFQYFPGAGDEPAEDPDPDRLRDWLSGEGAALNVLIGSEHTLITYSSGSTNLTVYDPSPAVLELIRQLAGAEGLFVWKPPQ